MPKKKTTTEFIEKSVEVHGISRYDYSDVKYINNRTKVTILCNLCGIKFMTRPTDHTTKSYGCPDCAKSYRSKSEKMAVLLVCEILELKEDEFKPANPTDVPWLKGLHLDGYSSSLSLALEYQGIQHSEFPNYFHSTEEEFKKQKSNDRKKYRRCNRKGIKLILIPHTISYKNKSKMYDWIYDQLIIFGILKKK